MKLKTICGIGLLIVIPGLFSSCGKMILNSLGAFEKTIPLQFISNGEKNIVYFPIHHIGTKEFYDDTKNKIDSLFKEGYVIFFEGVALGAITDSLQKDTVLRKARKVTGVDFQTARKNLGYIDTLNNTLLGMKTNLIKKYHLVNQPRNLAPKPDSVNVWLVDATFVQLINACESKYGPIKLDQYDMETNFGEKYKVKKNKEMSEYFRILYRNRLISERILKHKGNKLMLIYGAKHFNGILENLRAADSTYKEVTSL